ncbi:MAG TPA: LON peptidase substrate-binding domain-containing protein [Acidimicrobiales bacterium]|nr:LON peptidase substrate-binding domain-containing protein [Acidimicrobiales bacterium]
MSRRLPVFPLGTVLVPHGILPLHIFEQRYRALMNLLLWDGESGSPKVLEPGTEPEIGIVLIERGQEVGGGEQRTGLGTVARFLDVERTADGRFLVVLGGARRFSVVEWLPDDPYPVADVEDVPEDNWDPSWSGALEAAEREVRRALGLAGELADVPVLPALSSDPEVAAWQLCAAIPVGPFDRQRLLATSGIGDRLALLAELAADAASLLAFRLGEV